MSYQDKYLKYKNKYLELKSIIQSGGAAPLGPGAAPLGPGAAPLGSGALWNPDLPPHAKVGDHLQQTTGQYLGHIVKVSEDRLILNT
jgi:hypothetical protein